MHKGEGDGHIISSTGCNSVTSDFKAKCRVPPFLDTPARSPGRWIRLISQSSLLFPLFFLQSPFTLVPMLRPLAFRHHSSFSIPLTNEFWKIEAAVSSPLSSAAPVPLMLPTTWMPFSIILPHSRKARFVLTTTEPLPLPLKSLDGRSRRSLPQMSCPDSFFRDLLFLLVLMLPRGLALRPS
jgi:hypothetical protein